MKTAKSPAVAVDGSPSQKKLKQARLPFKVLSDVPPKPESPPTRKRKLSAPENDVAPKVGKISNENELTDDPVVIIDDDSRDASNGVDDQGEKQLNPFIKLVDIAIKRKQKKTPKRKRNSKSKSKTPKFSLDASADEDADKNLGKDSDVEMMEVDETSPTEDVKTVETADSTNNKTEKTSPACKKSPKSKSKSAPKTIKDSNDNKVVPKPQKTVPEPDVSIVLDDDSNSDSKITSEPKPDVEIQKPVSDEEKDQELTEEVLPVTPKRTRQKVQKSNSDDKNESCSKMDESTASNMSTPKQNKKGDESNELNTSLTPKQLQRKLESAKKRELREKDKQEKEQKRLQEKEERDKIKKEREDQKKKEREEKEEAKKKEREEKEEAKRKEKEEKEKLKEVEKKQKEEKEEQKKKEREEKEEAKRKEKETREEERRKKQEAQELEKQEQELKKKKAAEAFVNFFVPKQKVERVPTENPVSKNEMLSSFTIKADMRLAPTVRSNLTKDRRERLDEMIKQQGSKDLYVKLLKDGKSKPESMGKTWPPSEKDEDVVIIEDELPPLDGAGEVLACETAIREKLRPKLLSFHENRRPPYWGTWRKTSKDVTPRRPFGQDQKQLSYDCDSDSEWEEEAEGESLDGSVAGDDEPDDEYEVDNEVFVPHGYLSDEEATMDEDGEDMLSLSPEAQKARLKHLEDEFETEHKKPTEKLKPRLYGPIWETAEGGKPDNCADALWNYFGKFRMIMDDVTPLLQPAPETEETEKKKSRKKKLAVGDESSPKSEKKKAKLKEPKKAKVEPKKNTPEVKKNQLGINSFLKKISS